MFLRAPPIFHMNPFQRLNGPRKEKHYWLDERTIAAVEGLAEEHGLNKSRAAECLILMGLQDTHHIGMVEFMADVVAYEMKKQFNRFAKLSAMAALEAGAAKEASKAIYWWILMQEHGMYCEGLEPGQAPSLEDFEKMFLVDPDSVEGKQILNLYGRRNDRFRLRAVKALRNGITELDSLLEEVRSWEEGETE